MRGRLAAHTGSGLISPLIDIVCNGMASMFVFLIIYICIVRPQRSTMPLELLTDQLPEAVWYKPYQSVIGASGGVGAYSFQVADGALPDGVALDQRTGQIQGTPQIANGQAGRPKDCALTVRVTDATKTVRERTFNLHVCPAAIPFDPEKQVLRWATGITRLPDAWVGTHYEYTPGMLGGIEPYQVIALGLPEGIVVTEGRFSGSPHAQAVPEDAEFHDYTIHATVTDQQSAFLPSSVTRKPELSAEYVLRVRSVPKIEVFSVLPAFTRTGQSYLGAVVARGGRGKLKWRIGAGDLPAGLSVNADTGFVSGVIPGDALGNGRPASAEFSIEVDDEDASTPPAVLRDCKITVLPPMRFNAPD